MDESKIGTMVTKPEPGTRGYENNQYALDKGMNVLGVRLVGRTGNENDARLQLNAGGDAVQAALVEALKADARFTFKSETGDPDAEPEFIYNNKGGTDMREAIEEIARNTPSVVEAQAALSAQHQEETNAQNARNKAVYDARPQGDFSPEESLAIYEARMEKNRKIAEMKSALKGE